LDLSRANAFVSAYPKEQIGSFPPDFPGAPFDDFDKARAFFEGQGDSHIDAEERGDGRLKVHFIPKNCLSRVDNG
jgi:hypothetical protein